MATPLFRPARFKWCTTHPPSVWTKGGWGGGIVNLSGGEWGHGVSVKRSIGFLDRGWRMYSYCVDKSKDLAQWTPQSVCVFIRWNVCSQNNWVKVYYNAHKLHQTRLRSVVPYNWWIRILCVLCLYLMLIHQRKITISLLIHNLSIFQGDIAYVQKCVMM